MLHQIFRNKIYLENKVLNNKYLFYLSVNMEMFTSCSNDDIYYLLVINE